MRPWLACGVAEAEHMAGWGSGVAWGVVRIGLKLPGGRPSQAAPQTPHCAQSSEDPGTQAPVAASSSCSSAANLLAFFSSEKTEIAWT